MLLSLALKPTAADDDAFLYYEDCLWSKIRNSVVVLYSVLSCACPWLRLVVAALTLIR